MRAMKGIIKKEYMIPEHTMIRNIKKNNMIGLAAAIIAMPLWWIAWELGNISNKK